MAPKYEVEMLLYKNRPDLWSLSKVLAYCPTYKNVIWDLLSAEDQDSLRAYSKAYREAPETAKQARETGWEYLTSAVGK